MITENSMRKFKSMLLVARPNNKGFDLLVNTSVKVFYGYEPPSGESTITECVFDYQLLAVMY